ncbi:NucA/NucB deoxyribonuclease domain-containing protein [Saccharopolyspora dendranthemae]|nr:NucA/NucB deoxyribonuclease domain-containing protein [Saccharopolyspora dendranthemae]
MTATSIVDPALPGSISAATTSWTIRYTQMGSAPSEPAVYASEPVRCDTATPNAAAGCVLSRFTPTLTYTHARNGELAAHVADAQASGLPGSPLHSPLTRQTDPELITKNRAVACPSSRPRPPGDECDEYPFASTNQGAFLGEGYSRRMILKEDNRQGGTELAVFYLDNRVINFDPFNVEVTAG